MARCERNFTLNFLWAFHFIAIFFKRWQTQFSFISVKFVSYI